MAGFTVEPNEKELSKLTELCVNNSTIDPKLFTDLHVYRGLRAPDGTGVRTGLTEVADVKVYETVNGENRPCAGRLFYRGYDVKDIVADLRKSDRYGFEEVAFLLL